MDGALWGKENAKAILIDFAEFAKECSVECLEFMTSREDKCCKYFTFTTQGRVY